MRKLAVALVALAFIGSACGASGEGAQDSGEDDGAATTVADAGAGGSDDADFGDLTAPCGPGDLSVEASEAGRGTDKLYIGVGNDRTSDLRPGLQATIWDSSVAFAEWCNAQGGIGGLQIEIVDLPAALFNVEAAMTIACTDVFAMVGGGMAQDNLQFSGKEGSDFHQCGMIDIPAYAVSTEKSMSNGQVQPVPNPSTSADTTWFADFAELYPEDAERWAVAYGDIPSLEIPKLKYEAVVEDLGTMEQVGDHAYPVIGTTDWNPIGLSILEDQPTTLTWVGDTGDMVKALTAMRQQGWTGRPLLEGTAYDPLLFTGGAEVVEGVAVRMSSHPFEEAALWPATQKYLDLMDEYSPEGTQALLGIASMSAWLLFATAANACGESNDGVLTRDCILTEAAAVEDWTGGGLHGTTDPEDGPDAVSSSCSMLLTVTDGKFERLYPEVDGDDDDGGGFHCGGVTEVSAQIGAGVVDPAR
ncbi:MAG: ABC transporter substrate-binding protein [Microthrixaceae bacterium]